MANNKDDAPRGFARRNMLAGTGAGVAALAALATGLAPTPAKADAATDAATDYAVLNFALNLEYLEAEYYLRAVYGAGLAADDVKGTASLGAQGAVTGGTRVDFGSRANLQYAEEIAQDEMNHVRFLRSALDAAKVPIAAEPTIDLVASFNTLAKAAGLGSSFNPFADANSFLLGAYIFEDVGVTAYAGAAALITNKGYLTAAASILAVEAYHAGQVRTRLAALGAASQAATVAISNLRATLSGTGGAGQPPADDQGIVMGHRLNILPTDANSLTFTRTTRQVLNIVYGDATGKAASGLFFPNGLNGAIKV